MLTARTRPLITLAALLACLPVAAAPIEFDFLAPPNPVTANPYVRELWVQVTTPSGAKLTLPAYYTENTTFAVRVRPEEVGTYHFGAVAETTLGVKSADLVVTLVSPGDVANAARTRLPAVGVDPKNPRQFVRSDGVIFSPVGANLPWAPEKVADATAYYLKAIPAFAHANLNWMRIWMATWDGLNLDWLPDDAGPSPKPGVLSEAVARNWDQIIDAAEDNGVYVQMVLQYHGQYSTTNDTNWAANPWNAANGGFLKNPIDFFTDQEARSLTTLKYRYIIARWGYSPAVLAWELFNEVHWTDAMKQGHETDVARWHGQMAESIRSFDVYGHLVTTSTEDLRSPIYAKMDFYQPHLYAANLIAGARSFDPAPDTLDKPVFYGEEGDDHQPVSVLIKQSGLTLVPPIWASIMGEGSMAAQPWNGWQLYGQNRLGEVGAVFRFIALSRVTGQSGLKPFSAPVECAGRAPLVIPAGQFWQKRAAPDMAFPTDGTEPVEEADIPAILVGSAASAAEGYPQRVTYHVDLAAPTMLRVIVDQVSPAGGSLSVDIDGHPEVSRQWPASKDAFTPTVVVQSVAAGAHTVVVENPGPDWIAISNIELGVDGPVLASIGRRNDRFIEAWVWHRTNLYTLNTTPAVAGTLELKDVPAGDWKVTWWDTTAGTPGAPVTVHHPGGVLKVKTPPIERHAAVVLARVP